MAYLEPARIAPRRLPGTVVTGLLAVLAAFVALQLVHLPGPSASTAASPSTVPAPPSAAEAPGGALPREGPGLRLGLADGAVPDHTTVFDDDIPAVAKLDPALLRALRGAASDAADDDLSLLVDSGWRSAAYQEQLLREAISKYGSKREAARWVATPQTSAHVSGDAVDVGPSRAAAWLAKHGARYGLCPIYRNEPWHFELRVGAVAHGCPAMYADPTGDPRMHQ